MLNWLSNASFENNYAKGAQYRNIYLSADYYDALDIHTRIGDRIQFLNNDFQSRAEYIPEQAVEVGTPAMKACISFSGNVTNSTSNSSVNGEAFIQKSYSCEP